MSDAELFILLFKEDEVCKLLSNFIITCFKSRNTNV